MQLKTFVIRELYFLVPIVIIELLPKQVTSEKRIKALLQCTGIPQKLLQKNICYKEILFVHFPSKLFISGKFSDNCSWTNVEIFSSFHP